MKTEKGFLSFEKWPKIMKVHFFSTFLWIILVNISIHKHVLIHTKYWFSIENRNTQRIDSLECAETQYHVSIHKGKMYRNTWFALFVSRLSTINELSIEIGDIGEAKFREWRDPKNMHSKPEDDLISVGPCYWVHWPILSLIAARIAASDRNFCKWRILLPGFWVK